MVGIVDIFGVKMGGGVCVIIVDVYVVAIEDVSWVTILDILGFAKMTKKLGFGCYKGH